MKRFVRTWRRRIQRLWSWCMCMAMGGWLVALIITGFAVIALGVYITVEVNHTLRACGVH